MLSYAKHGKFPALTQAAQAETRRKKRRFRSNDVAVIPVPHLQWIMGWNGLQMRRVRFLRGRGYPGRTAQPVGRRCGLAPAKEAAQKRFAQPLRLARAQVRSPLGLFQ